MPEGRYFERADIPQLVDLCPRAFPEAKPYPTADYFEEFFFRTPFVDEEIRSVVCVEDDGRIVGFIGVMPRRFVFKEEPVRFAVVTRLMFDRAVRSTPASMVLVNRFLSGPQDLTYADSTNAPGCVFWQAFGSQAVWPYGVNWRCTLRPAPSRGLRARLERRRTLRLAGALASPFFDMLDEAAAARWRKRHPVKAPDASCSEIDAGTIVAEMPGITGRLALRPSYEPDSLDWLIRRAAAKTVNGDLKVMGVRDRRGNLLGWFIYYLKKGGVCLLLQLVARPNAAAVVLECLIEDAAKGGAAAIEGRLEPSLLRPLAERWDVSYQLSRYWTLAHTRNPELMAAVHGGNALLSKFDGEWSMAFHGESLTDHEQLAAA